MLTREGRELGLVVRNWARVAPTVQLATTTKRKVRSPALIFALVLSPSSLAQTHTPSTDETLTTHLTRPLRKNRRWSIHPVECLHQLSTPTNTMRFRRAPARRPKPDLPSRTLPAPLARLRLVLRALRVMTLDTPLRRHVPLLLGARRPLSPAVRYHSEM